MSDSIQEYNEGKPLEDQVPPDSWIEFIAQWPYDQHLLIEATVRRENWAGLERIARNNESNLRLVCQKYMKLKEALGND